MAKSRNKNLIEAPKTQSEMVRHIMKYADLLSYRNLDKLQGLIDEKLWDKYGAINLEIEQNSGDSENDN